MAKQSNRRWVISTIVLAILALLFFILMLIYVVKYHNALKDNGGTSDKSEMKSNGGLMINKKHEKSDKLYKDFTHKEYDAIINYMKTKSNLGVVAAAEADLNTNYIFAIDPILPSKSEVLNYLNGEDVSLPTIKAKVTLFMGASTPKAIRELVVYPIDEPKTLENFTNPRNIIPSWQSRPVCNLVETGIIDKYLLETLKPLTPMLKAHLNTWYDDTCEGSTCLFFVPVPRVVPGITDRTIYIFFHSSPSAQLDYYLWITPLSMVIYTPDNGDRYEVKTVEYDNVLYDSIQDLVDAYENGRVRNQTAGVEKNYTNSFGNPKRRGVDVNPGKLPPPSLNTESKRFSVAGHHVSWLGLEFDFAFSAISAAQLYNIKFNGESIVYQLGLQDIFVMYTGSNLNAAFRSYMDVGWSIGSRTSSLLKGYDCPESAEYITAMVYEVGLDRPITLENCACVFEYRNHIPLRRHYSTDFFDYSTFRFNMNMPDVVLVFRQILTIWNYDYIADVEMHQSGVIKASITPTGYVQVARQLSSNGIKYGYDILPNPGITALLHNHFFLYKTDLDVGDFNKNQFMTIDIEHESTNHPLNADVNMTYMVMKESVKSSELQAIVHYDFTTPKQYVVFNNEQKNPRNGQPKGYRIQSESWAYPAIPSDDQLLRAPSWVNHQISVTKRKDNEDSTLSYFSQGDPYKPDVSLSHFQEDDESITNTDLVCWVSIGVNHIPTAEDIPVTTTASKSMSFHLIPHNYYEEDPSIASRDAQLLFPKN